MTAEKIEFSLVHGTEEVFPRPFAANRDIPDWFKAMPTEGEAPGISLPTVKNCPPFIEAMTCGYLIPLVADISLSLDRAGVFHGHGPTGYSPSRYANIVQIHQSTQVKGAPFEYCPVVKILNPWLIRTPPGYSTLFLAPLNRYQMPLMPLAGLVETDTFYREVNFPAVLMISPGTSLTVRKGTPFVQALPIKREEFQSACVPLDLEVYKTSRPATPEDKDNFYKNHFWEKKHYH
jgi:Family of unknown function (DUF6065)